MGGTVSLSGTSETFSGTGGRSDSMRGICRFWIIATDETRELVFVVRIHRGRILPWWHRQGLRCETPELIGGDVASFALREVRNAWTWQFVFVRKCLTYSVASTIRSPAVERCSADPEIARPLLRRDLPHLNQVRGLLRGTG
jgi:hypothetical protein